MDRTNKGQNLPPNKMSGTFNEGYIKLHRKIIESSVWKNPNTLAVWLWCLLKAGHKPTKFPFNGVDIELGAGEFITGREIACKEIKISPQTYRTCITYLKSTSRITTKPTNRFTIISIVNWQEYQKSTSQLTNQSNNHQPTTNQPLTTNKNDKNDKNVKKDVAAQSATGKVINDLIELFKPVNPSYTRLYANKTQRSALERMLKLHGAEKMTWLIQRLPITNKIQYAPTITTPYHLEMKLGDIIAFLQKKKSEHDKNIIPTL